MGRREKRLAAVNTRLQEVIAKRDFSHILTREALREAARLAKIADADVADLEAQYVLGSWHLCRYLALPPWLNQPDRDAAVERFTRCFIAGTGGMPDELLPDIVLHAVQAATDLLAQAASTTDQALVTAAVDVWQRIVDGIPAGQSGRPMCLYMLGNALRTRFDRAGAKADLDAAIEAYTSAVNVTPADDPDRPMYQSYLAGALGARFDLTGGQADLDAAVEAGQAAVDAAPAGHPSRAMFLSNLAGVQKAGFDGTGHVGYLNSAIEAIQGAVDATSAGDPDRPMYLSNLSSVLRIRFDRLGMRADLDEAIGACQAAADATPAGDPSRATMLSHLGGALERRFERTGAQADLDTAIQADQAAVDTAAVGSPARAGFLNNLGVALRFRFERAGARADLDAAVKACQDAVDATPPGYRARAWRLSNLGLALQHRYERVGVLADIDAAVKACQDAVDATHHGDADAPMYLSNLGGALVGRFERTGATADLDAAIRACQDAVDATPAGQPDRAVFLSNLGGALHYRYAQTGAQHDVEASIKACQDGVDATPADHPDRGRCLVNLGAALSTRFEHTAAPADRDAALSAYAQAVTADSAPPSMRINAARMAASLAAGSEPGQAADLLEIAVRLLPQVAPRQLERGDQQYAIGGFAGLANDAAALALADISSGASGSERAARALGLLEAGRAVLLSQALDTRSDLTDLRRQHPELATRFTELRDHLDQPSDASALAGGASFAAARPGQAAEDRRHLAVEFAAILEQIHALEGFGSFGLPPTVSELLAEAASGPVVTFNVSAYRSDALLLTGDNVTCLDLPGLTYEALTGQISSFHQVLHAAADPGADIPQLRAAQEKLLEILGWLWDAAAGSALEALGYHSQPPTGAAWPRVWWAPGGLLGLLPIHAAGHHSEPPAGDQARRTVMDRVISSWTPTIRALRYARQHVHDVSGHADRALIVAMPITPGLPGGGELANVPEEFARVRALLPDPVILAEPGILGVPASGSSGIPTKANVMAQLPACSIAHFACHGFSDPADPSKSLLLLNDYSTDPFTVASLAPVELGRAQLAYLSACDTARTSTAELIDEAIHLTTAFQLAGFPHVIGTLWEINDEIAVTIADTFYTSLRASPGNVNTSKAARALHDAVHAVRAAHPKAPSLWAAYLHAGT